MRIQNGTTHELDEHVDAVHEGRAGIELTHHGRATDELAASRHVVSDERGREHVATEPVADVAVAHLAQQRMVVDEQQDGHGRRLAQIGLQNLGALLQFAPLCGGLSLHGHVTAAERNNVDEQLRRDGVRLRVQARM